MLSILSQNELMLIKKSVDEMHWESIVFLGK